MSSGAFEHRAYLIFGAASGRPVQPARRSPEERGQMIQRDLHARGPDLGRFGTVCGSVVDVHFDKQLPTIHSMLHANEGRILVEVLAQRRRFSRN
jgi:hypothetical protein